MRICPECRSDDYEFYKSYDNGETVYKCSCGEYISEGPTWTEFMYEEEYAGENMLDVSDELDFLDEDRPVGNIHG